MSIKNWILLSVLSILWGASFYFIEKALENFSFEKVVFFRVFFATLFVYVYILLKKIKIILSLKAFVLFTIMACLNNIFPFLLITHAQESISASLASIFNATTPIFTALLSHFIFKNEKLKPLKFIALILGFIGIMILLFPSSTMNFQSASLFALLGAVSYALAGTFGRYLKEYNPILSVFYMLFCSSCILFIIFYKNIITLDITSYAIFNNVLLLAFFSTFIAYIIYFKLLFSVGAVKLLLVTYLIPISASLLGIIFLNERFTLNMLIASLFILLSLYLINYEKQNNA